jgi:hypothetical protein
VPGQQAGSRTLWAQGLPHPQPGPGSFHVPPAHFLWRHGCGQGIGQGLPVASLAAPAQCDLCARQAGGLCVCVPRVAGPPPSMLSQGNSPSGLCPVTCLLPGNLRLSSVPWCRGLKGFEDVPYWGAPTLA